MTEEKLSPGFRMLSIFVEPGQDISISAEGFHYWELQAVLFRAMEKIEEDAEIDYDLARTDAAEEDEEDDE